jgi:dGTPase
MILAPYASDPARSRGRLHDERSRGTRGPRDAFQRDRDRIIHSVAFRRLRHKTQVFVAPDGDHFRVRLTHSLEVAQIARTIARALSLNEDLTEALALAHDIGHPPFGHAGEYALQAAMEASGGFDHNANTIRVLTRLETPYPDCAGLNLSWETLEGLAKHNGPVSAAPWALAEYDAAHALDLQSWPGLEAQVAALADDIAYDNHDIDDGLRAGLFTLDDLLTVPFVASSWESVRSRFPDTDAKRLVLELTREMIGHMVNNLISESRDRIAASGVKSVEDVREAGQALIAFSPAMLRAEHQMKAFLRAHMYRHPAVLELTHAAQAVVGTLAEAYLSDPARMPQDWGTELPGDALGRARHIGDFISGMTDRYALSRYVQLTGKSSPLPDGF